MRFPFELYIDFANNIFKSVRFRVLSMIFHVLIHIIPCNNQRCEVKIFTLFYFPALAIAACAAAAPDSKARLGNELEFARAACDVGYKSMLFKSNDFSCHDRAYLIRQELQGSEVFASRTASASLPIAI